MKGISKDDSKDGLLQCGFSAAHFVFGETISFTAARCNTFAQAENGTMQAPVQIFQKSCYGLSELEGNSIDCMLTDPPYGISFQNHYWDKDLPDKAIWTDSLRVLKPGAFAAVFSSVRLMHRLMVDLEDSGFLIKDVLFWAFLNGMPKSREVALDIDKELGVESEVIGHYKYVQGYKKGGADQYYAADKKVKRKPASELGKKYAGAGLGIKPSYEPIILIQKPIDKGLSVAQSMIQYGVGALNLEQTRLPYEEGEGKVGHNPHPAGRVMANMIRVAPHHDGYDKYFLIPKVRQHAEAFNDHPTKKPVELMQQLVKLLSWERQTILDPFMGSGSTGLACSALGRLFVGYEKEPHYFQIAQKRLGVLED